MWQIKTVSSLYGASLKRLRNHTLQRRQQREQRGLADAGRGVPLDHRVDSRRGRAPGPGAPGSHHRPRVRGLSPEPVLPGPDPDVRLREDALDLVRPVCLKR